MEYKQALPDRILFNIEKPARYTGGEVNSVYKDPDKVDVRFCMCFPDVYEIGMSNLGVQIIYSVINEHENFWCERTYSPWPDLHKIMKEENIPLFTMESQTPVKEMDFLGITLQYEMCYTNVLQILDLSRVPRYNRDRNEDDPIVLGGGTCAYNPEPLADFFDIFYMGEGETQFGNLLTIYNENKKSGGSRLDFLKKAAQVPGMYVPLFYEAAYNEDGTLRSFGPKPEYADVAPVRIIKEACPDMNEAFYPTKPIVPYVQVTQDRAVLEILRGCIRGCRFCQAGVVYRPFRTKNLDVLKKAAVELIDNTGYDELSLSSLSSSDLPWLGKFMDFLLEELGSRNVNISLPSLRIDEFSLDVMSKVQDVKKSSLTFAPEAGTQRLRDVINKGITNEDIMNGASLAFKGGWSRVKLYFMLGQPTETEEDIKGIADIAEELAELYYDEIPKEQRVGKKVQITVSTSFFVPKPHTAFQWEPMLHPEEYLERAHLLNDTIKGLLNKKSIRYMWHDADTTVIEGLLARGDRRIGKVIENVYDDGGIFDAWTEFFDYDRWLRAVENAGLSMDFYVYRRRSLDELLPWDFIDAGASKEFFLREYKNSLAEKVTPNCRERCSGCGAAKFTGGICSAHQG